MGGVLDLTKLVGDKPIFKSMTVWGVLIFVGVTAMLDQACSQGLISEVTCGTMTAWAKNIGGVLTVLGLRRAATAENVA